MTTTNRTQLLKSYEKILQTSTDFWQFIQIVFYESFNKKNDPSEIMTGASGKQDLLKHIYDIW